LLRNPMSLRRVVAACAAVSLLAIAAMALNPCVVSAQDAGGSDMMGPIESGSGSMNPSMATNDPSMLPPMPKLHLPEQITGSMLAAPPYGFAPMRVGFFVLANDPEGFGFLTYSWNFGDGTVSALPPELYIFHTYKKPGSYLCSLTVKTVDGRSKIFMQGVLVKPRAGG
jgi:PKD domain